MTDPTTTALPRGEPLLTVLEGMVLTDGWTIGTYRGKPADNSGGFFSEGYDCKQSTGASAFLKVLDLSRTIDESNFVASLNRLTDAFLCEKELLEKCKGMDRVVKAIATGEIREVQGQKLRIPAPYIIFERADGTVRQAVNASSPPSHAWALRVLQQVATGIRQLHRVQIAHQDLKLSNVLHFAQQSVHKVSDLGRSVAQDRPVHYDQEVWPGDWTVAPPEVMFGFQLAEFNVRRLAADLYLLAGFACTLFTGVSLNALFYRNLPLEFHPPRIGGPYTGTFENVKPHLYQAFLSALDAVKTSIPSDAPYREDITRFIGEWGTPDPRDRGHPVTRAYNQRSGNIFELELYLSPLATLEKRAAAYEKQRKKP